jgi:hypothetical protein
MHQAAPTVGAITRLASVEARDALALRGVAGDLRDERADELQLVGGDRPGRHRSQRDVRAVAPGGQDRSAVRVGDAVDVSHHATALPDSADPDGEGEDDGVGRLVARWCGALMPVANTR